MQTTQGKENYLIRFKKLLAFQITYGLAMLFNIASVSAAIPLCAAVDFGCYCSIDNEYIIAS